MNDYSKKFILGIFPLLVAVVNAQTPRVDLFVQPDIQSEIIATVNLDDPRLGEASPVLDEGKAALGWHWTEFTSEISAYVKDSKIGKDLAPVEGALIYLKPSEDSPVLGAVEPDDSFEILDNGPWWEILFDRPIPVYFIPESPAVMAPAETPAESGATMESTAPDDGSTGQAEAESRGEPERSVQVEESPARDVPAARPSEETTRLPGTNNPYGAESLGFSIEGTFRKANQRFGIWDPPYSYYIEDSRGKRIAWVDTEELLVTSSLRKYIDEPVILYGERVYDKKGKSWKIVAHNIRLQ